MKYKIPANWAEDNSYYPDINHSADKEVELEEYVYTIHNYIDWVLGNIQLRDTIIRSTGIPKSYIVNQSSFTPTRSLLSRYAKSVIKKQHKSF